MKVKAALAGKIPLGSHDDTTVEHVSEAHEAGATLSEMPVHDRSGPAGEGARNDGVHGSPNYLPRQLALWQLVVPGHDGGRACGYSLQ